jgi:hypothetical protein
MLVNLFMGLFHKRCPLCKQEVREEGHEAVQRLGKWFCSKVHADLYELELYEALRTVRCRHVGCHGEYGPLSAATHMSFTSRPGVELARLTEDRGRCFAPRS